MIHFYVRSLIPFSVFPILKLHPIGAAHLQRFLLSEETCKSGKNLSRNQIWKPKLCLYSQVDNVFYIKISHWLVWRVTCTVNNNSWQLFDNSLSFYIPIVLPFMCSLRISGRNNHVTKLLGFCSIQGNVHNKNKHSLKGRDARNWQSVVMSSQ